MSKLPSIKSLALAYLRENIGTICTRAEIEAFVRDSRGTATAGEVTRRIRELRGHDGWSIETDKDASDLSPGEYRLLSRIAVPAQQRNVSQRTRYAILDRDGSTCQKCGVGAGEPDPWKPGGKTTLVIDHRSPFPTWSDEQGDWNGAGNLITLCSNCNAGKKAFFGVTRPAIDILQTLRASPIAIQRQVLLVLKHKFEGTD